MTKKIYVASSWRNEHQESLVNELRQMGHEVYDFKHPNGEDGFQWSNIDEDWQNWTMEQYRENLKTEYAQFGLNRDFDAMKAADACVLCLPCGRSAHLEAGWMKGAGKKVYAYIHPGEKIEPELMYGIIDGIAFNLQELAAQLNKTTFVYGAMSSKYSLEAADKRTAYVAMVAHFGRSNHLIALYEPEEIVKNDSWLNPFGQVSARLDEIFGGDGEFDKYADEHIDEIRAAMDTIKQIL